VARASIAAPDLDELPGERSVEEDVGEKISLSLSFGDSP
jgi:hypothetical protein